MLGKAAGVSQRCATPHHRPPIVVGCGEAGTKQQSGIAPIKPPPEGRKLSPSSGDQSRQRAAERRELSMVFPHDSLRRNKRKPTNYPTKARGRERKEKEKKEKSGRRRRNSRKPQPAAFTRRHMNSPATVRPGHTEHKRQTPAAQPHPPKDTQPRQPQAEIKSQRSRTKPQKTRPRRRRAEIPKTGRF